tara:strand:- start:1062 stop:1391 length:330 start_codon:yes stop_codon:yes gene_type:complete
MTMKIKRIYQLLELKYLKSTETLPGFRRASTAITVTIIGIIPVIILAALDIGIASLPLGYGITFCILRLVTNEEVYEEQFEISLPEIKRDIGALEKELKEKKGNHYEPQ